MSHEKPPQIRLKPGIRCDIIVSSSHFDEKSDVRTATVYDIIGDTVILSQMTPPLTTRLLGKPMDLTFLDKGKDKTVRRGFLATVSKILTDYKLQSDESVQAVVMALNKPIKENTYDLRMFYRVKAAPNCGIQIYMGGTSVQLLDFSAAGLRFNHKTDLSPKTGQSVTVTLAIDGQRHDADVKIVRQFKPPHEYKQPVECLCVEFIRPSRRLQDLLTKKVLEVERYQLSRGLL